MRQLNFKPTRHRVGNLSSLLDLVFSNIPERITNIENFFNTLSEHEGVRCVVHTKSQVRAPNTFILRDYNLCTFNNLQPLVDSSEPLQSLFTESDPEVIADTLMKGLKDITDLTVLKRKVQITVTVPSWCTLILYDLYLC